MPDADIMIPKPYLDCKNKIISPKGILNYHYKIIRPKGIKELTDPEYVEIWAIYAEPCGHRLLRHCGKAMIDQIKSHIGNSRKIILQPSSSRVYDKSAQSVLEAYYISSGFQWLPNSSSWMTFNESA